MAYQTIAQGTSPRKADITQTMVQVTDSATGDWYILPDGIGYAAVEIIPATSGKVQHTLDIAGVIAGTATGVDWDAGVVTEATTQILRGGGAIRMVSTSGILNGFIRGSL